MLAQQWSKRRSTTVVKKKIGGMTFKFSRVIGLREVVQQTNSEKTEEEVAIMGVTS